MSVLQQAKDRFALVVSAESEQRKRELDDLEFDAGNQWPDEVKAARGGQVVDGVPIPARPMLTINKLDQPIQLIINQQKNARLGIEVRPDSEDADDDTAEVLQGLIRHIEVQSRADLARSWAFERAVKCGRGYYRVLKRFSDDSKQEFDQELVIERILNQGSVYLDPYAQQPDWSDGEWAMVSTMMPADRFKAEFPDSKVSASLGDTFSSLGDSGDGWYGTTEDGQQAVRVVEYFVVEKTPMERVAYVNDRGQLVTAWADDIPDTVRPEQIQQRRSAERRNVRWYKLNGEEILDEADWDGQYIPIIPVVGREQNIDGKRKWIGIIHPSKDGQRLFNYSVSTAVETAALEPKAPFIGFEGQFEGHEASWAQANIRNFPYLEVKPITLGGQAVPLPQRNTAGANLGPSLALVEQADSYIKSTTFVYDPSLGSSAGSRSGRAVLALQQQADIGNSNYLENLASISMTYEAKVLLDLIPKIYDRPGRVARILGTDDELKQVVLNAPFTMGPNGRPLPSPPGMGEPGRPAMAPGGVPPFSPPVPAGRPRTIKRYDLAQGKYVATVSIGKAYRTRVEQGADELGQVLQASPNLMPLIGDLYFKYRDFPGHLEIAKRLKKMAPPEIRDEHEEIDPQQVLAQMEQMKAETGQIIEQMTAQMQEMTKTIEQKVIEQQGAIQKAQIDAQARVEVARIQADAQMRVADVKTTSGDLKAQLASETSLLASQRQTDTKMQVELLKQMATRQENTPATTVAITVNAEDGEDDDTIDEAPSRREDA
jgi:hypothetical protein